MLNKQMIDLCTIFDQVPSGKFLNEVLDAFENSGNTEDFMEAYCVLLGLPIKKDEQLKPLDIYEYCDWKKPVPFKYNLPDRIKYMA